MEIGLSGRLGTESNGQYKNHTLQFSHHIERSRQEAGIEVRILFYKPSGVQKFKNSTGYRLSYKTQVKIKK